jgi:redox-sensitive bicupin YhaK (pirin superfamily)
LKRIEAVLEAPPRHWVGDGFPVRSVFSYQAHGNAISPFLLLDYAAPTRFEAASRRRGVGSHPHRGFETVTIVYAGEVSHRDSSGGGGTIREGDVQWMTAGSGVVHDEFHSETFTRSGGGMEMAQLWVNLPARYKMTPPRYQTLTRDTIPSVALPGGGSVRVIAGGFGGQHGPAQTFLPVDVQDVNLPAGARFEAPAGAGRRLIIVLLTGKLTVNDDVDLADVSAVIFGTAGENAVVTAGVDSHLLLLCGEPIDEPIAGYGPFVMNTEQEIREAIADFSQGRFGSLPAEAAAGEQP